MMLLPIFVGALVAVIVIVAVRLRRRTRSGASGALSSHPIVRQPSCVRVLRTEEEIRAVAAQVRDRERGIALAAERRAARLNALVQPPT